MFAMVTLVAAFPPFRPVLLRSRSALHYCTLFCAVRQGETPAYPHCPSVYFACVAAGKGRLRHARGAHPCSVRICGRKTNKMPRGERRGAEVGVSKVRGRRRTIRWRAMPQFRPPRRAGKGARGMPQCAYYAASLKFSSIAVKSNLTGVKIYSQSSMTIARVCAGKPEKIGIFSSSLSCSPSKCSKR